LANKNKKKRSGINLMIISSILSLNLIGIGYAQWNDGLNIVTSISTGNIDPIFIEKNIDNLNDKGTLTAKMLDKRIIWVEGQVETDYEGILSYGLQNNGSIPVKFGRTYDNQCQTMSLKNMNEGLELELNQQNDILEPRKDGDIAQRRMHFKDYQSQNNLKIRAMQEGKHYFEIEIPFRQWNAR